MKKPILFAICALVGALSGLISAQASESQPVTPAHHDHMSAYAGQQDRDIKSLSSDDIAELKAGSGWGLAKAAELNGVPGPVHLLELKDQVPLDQAQVLILEALYKDMNDQAREKGEELILLERRLEHHFRDGTITSELLAEMLDQIATVRRDLRFIHLSTHLQTPKLLKSEQISRYNELRGYTAVNQVVADPCAAVPEGHDAAMWRKHNDCD
ncbi:hypothetical protein [uncultured Cohaesibacter sp.]|uniref:hypothetical protein n=1 Tax=uncultured Cohaesibacter sp. TaxID=1002546 RepID=UPI0029C84F1C|nr:hypothetical protein [uncultured Cohaesibacter sp.]